jgi:hypothetical protein
MCVFVFVSPVLTPAERTEFKHLSEALQKVRSELLLAKSQYASSEAEVRDERVHLHCELELLCRLKPSGTRQAGWRKHHESRLACLHSFPHSRAMSALNSLTTARCSSCAAICAADARMLGGKPVRSDARQSRAHAQCKPHQPYAQR